MVLADHSVDVSAQDGAAGEEGGEAAERAGHGGDGPPVGEAVHETGDGVGGRVPDEGGEGGDEYEGKDDEPAAGELAPRLGNGRQPAEEAVRVDNGEDDEGPAEEAAEDGEDAVQRRQAEVVLDEPATPVEIFPPNSLEERSGCA